MTKQLYDKPEIDRLYAELAEARAALDGIIQEADRCQRIQGRTGNEKYGYGKIEAEARQALTSPAPAVREAERRIVSAAMAYHEGKRRLSNLASSKHEPGDDAYDRASDEHGAVIVELFHACEALAAAKEPETHIYQGSAMHMGDCAKCGRSMDAPVHRNRPYKPEGAERWVT